MSEDRTITEKDFKNISKWAENVYNMAVVLDYFCYNQPEIEELYNITPIIKHLKSDADRLNAFFIDNEKGNAKLNNCVNIEFAIKDIEAY